MSRLRAALVTPLTGRLARFGRESATALTLWAGHAANLPPPWTGVDLEVLDAGEDAGPAMRAAADLQPDVLFGPYGSSTMLAAARAADRVVWNHGGERLGRRVGGLGAGDPAEPLREPAGVRSLVGLGGGGGRPLSRA